MRREENVDDGILIGGKHYGKRQSYEKKKKMLICS